MTEHEKFILVGIVEKSNNKVTSKLLESILVLSGYENCYRSNDNSILFFTSKDKCIFIMNIDINKISTIADMGFEFHIIVHTFLEPDDYKNLALKSILKSSKYLLINSDERDWTYLIEEISKPVVITYGFNNKATFNLSSYNIDHITEANICLQRRISPINNSLVEPFELPIKINTRDKLKIYLVLAVILCGLVIGIDITPIKSYMYFDKINGEKGIIQ